MDIKKELEQKLLNKEMTLLEMDNAILDVLELDEENSYPRVKNSVFAYFEPAGIIERGHFAYVGSESFFDIYFEAATDETGKADAADTFDAIIKVTEINRL